MARTACHVLHLVHVGQQPLDHYRMGGKEGVWVEEGLRWKRQWMMAHVSWVGDMESVVDVPMKLNGQSDVIMSAAMSVEWHQQQQRLQCCYPMSVVSSRMIAVPYQQRVGETGCRLDHARSWGSQVENSCSEWGMESTDQGLLGYPVD